MNMPIISILANNSNYNLNRNYRENNVNKNGNCHSYGVINYNTTLPCNRSNVVPLYVKEICKTKSNGCLISYNNCINQLTCTNSNCKLC